MNDLLRHTDRILAARRGKVLMACDTIEGVNMSDGGRLKYALGSKFRVKFSSGDILWCVDEEARSVSFLRSDLAALEAAS